VRSYKQYCALARALDVVGERWALLVVRELLDGPRRYGELLEGLPGVATNLLAERLRSLVESRVAVRRPDGRYALTPWGEGLHEAIYALGRWAAPLMARPVGDHAFRLQWLRHLVVAHFEGMDKLRGELTVEIRCGDERMALISAAGRVHLIPGRAATPDLVLNGPPDGLAAALAGQLDRPGAEARGVSIVGDFQKLSGLRPRAARMDQLSEC
jgi:DNA-binding HxlR family transcriptional regulator